MVAFHWDNDHTGVVPLETGLPSLPGPLPVWSRYFSPQARCNESKALDDDMCELLFRGNSYIAFTVVAFTF